MSEIPVSVSKSGISAVYHSLVLLCQRSLYCIGHIRYLFKPWKKKHMKLERNCSLIRRCCLYRPSEASGDPLQRPAPALLPWAAAAAPRICQGKGPKRFSNEVNLRFLYLKQIRSPLDEAGPTQPASSGSDAITHSSPLSWQTRWVAASRQLSCSEKRLWRQLQ